MTTAARAAALAELTALYRAAGIRGPYPCGPTWRRAVLRRRHCKGHMPTDQYQRRLARQALARAEHYAPRGRPRLAEAQRVASAAHRKAYNAAYDDRRREDRKSALARCGVCRLRISWRRDAGYCRCGVDLTRTAPRAARRRASG